MVKVLHLITNLDGGGAERQLLHLCRDQDPRISYHVLSLRQAGDLLPSFQATGKYLGSLGMTSGRPSISALVSLCHFIKEVRPDVIQTWLYHADLIGLLASKVMNVPALFWNIRCSDMDLSRYSNLTRLVVWLNKKLSTYPSGILFNSYAGQKAHQVLGYKNKNWHYMPNGFNIPAFNPQPSQKEQIRDHLGIPHNAHVVGMVARVDPMKDYDTLFKAVATVQKKDPHLHLVVIGKDTENLAYKFTGDQDRLHCLGFQKAPSSFIPCFDMFVLASRFGEGFPNVIGEAMALGIPSFSSNVGDARHIIGDSAFLFKKEKAKELEKKITDFFLLSQKDKQDLSKACHERIKSHYSLETLHRNYRDLYLKTNKVNA